jgi:hypothetical protein
MGLLPKLDAVPVSAGALDLKNQDVSTPVALHYNVRFSHSYFQQVVIV